MPGTITVMSILQQVPWKPIAWIGLLLAGSAGLLMVLSPRRFARVAAWCNLWVDTDPLFKKLDYRVEIDAYVLRYARLFGVLVVAASLVLVYFPLRFAALDSWICWAAIGLVGGMGMLAVLTPRRFARLAEWGGLWTDTDRLARRFDRRIEIDSYLLPYTRPLGVALLAAAVVLAILVCRLP